MAITWTRYSATVTSSEVQATTSPSLTLATGDIIAVAYGHSDNGLAGALSIANSGSALSWNLSAQTNTGSNTKVSVWWALCPDNTARTVTVTSTAGQTKRLHCIVHTGAHQTDPLPSGKVYSGTGATDVSQLITPTATGSALWMLAGDWAATNTFAAGANCTLEDSFHDAGQMSLALVRPTTQPRTDAAAFTISETDTAGTIAWIAFEVQAAAVADAPKMGRRIYILP